MVKKTPVSVYRLLSSPSNKRIVFLSSHGSPCTCSGPSPPTKLPTYLNLSLFLRQPGKSLPSDTPKVDLRPCRQVDIPQLGISGGLGRAHQGVRGGAQEISTSYTSEGPPARIVIAHRDLKLGGVVLLLVLTGHVAKLIHGKVLVKM